MPVIQFQGLLVLFGTAVTVNRMRCKGEEPHAQTTLKRMKAALGPERRVAQVRGDER